MSVLPQIAFLVIFAIAGVILYKRISFLRRNIFLGKREQRNDQPEERWKTMLLVALGQKKMFKRFIPAFLHLLIYVAFIIINLEVLEFIIDGLSGAHRIFAPALGGLYTVAMNIFEFLAIAVLVSCVAFLIRRNVMHIKRFRMGELKGWPALDANLILIIEVILMFAILTMNATDQILAERGVEKYVLLDGLFFSGLIQPLFVGMSETCVQGIIRGLGRGGSTSSVSRLHLCDVLET
ncbi:oxidoreductase, fe-s subunit, partial [Nitritalea halalkaliphila LW7]